MVTRSRTIVRIIAFSALSLAKQKNAYANVHKNLLTSPNKETNRGIGLARPQSISRSQIAECFVAANFSHRIDFGQSA